jgi:hypothetical protein
MFEEGQRIRIISITAGDLRPDFRIGDEGVITLVSEGADWANVRFDNHVSDIVNFDEMEVIT